MSRLLQILTVVFNVLYLGLVVYLMVEHGPNKALVVFTVPAIFNLLGSINILPLLVSGFVVNSLALLLLTLLMLWPLGSNDLTDYGILGVLIFTEVAFALRFYDRVRGRSNRQIELTQ